MAFDRLTVGLTDPLVMIEGSGLCKPEAEGEGALEAEELKSAAALRFQVENVEMAGLFERLGLVSPWVRMASGERCLAIKVEDLNLTRISRC